MYHRLASQEEYERTQGTERIFTLPTDLFERQIAWLSDHGYAFLTPDQVRDYAAGSARVCEPAVLVTFDDGCRSFKDLAVPILVEYKARATIFVTTDPNSYVFSLGEKGDPRLSDDDLRALDPEYISVESHAVSHRPLRGLSDDEIRYELGASREALQQVLSRDVRYLAIPGNWFDDRVMRIARSVGYEAVWCSNPGTVRPGSHLLGLPRLNVEGQMTFDQFVASIRPWGIAQRRAISWLKRTPGRLLGPRYWLPIRKAIMRLIPGHHLSARRVRMTVLGLLVIAVLLAALWLVL